MTPDGSGADWRPQARLAGGDGRPGSARRPADHDPAAGARRTTCRTICAIRSKRSRPRWTVGRRRASEHGTRSRWPRPRWTARAHRRVATASRRGAPPGGRPPARRAAGQARRCRTGAGSQRIDWSRLEHINWRWVRRGLYVGAVVLLLLPIVTFAMAYFIVDIPKPGDIRTNQVSTILASDGSELAKIVPPEGNRVDVNIDQVPVHVRQAVIAAEDRNFYSNPGFSFTGFARAFKNNIFGGDTAGRVDDHPAVRQERVGGSAARRRRRPDPQGQGTRHRHQDVGGVVQRRCAAGLPEHHLLRPRRLRHLGGVAGLLRQAGRAAHRRRRRAAGRADPAAVDAGPGRRPRGRHGAGGTGCSTAWSTISALSPTDRAAQQFPPTVPPEQARAQNQTTGPNGLIQRQVTRELMELFNIDEQTLNTQGLQITTTIDPKAQKAAEDAVSKYMEGQNPDMRTAVVSIDPHNGAVKAYYGGADANGFDFAQAGLQTGSSFKVFALIAALEQGIGLGYQVDSSPLTVNGIKITNVEGEGCGVCNIAEALKRSLNTSYYRLMLKLKNGPEDVADAAHQAGIATSFPGVAHTLSEDGKGGPPNNGIVLGQYQTRAIDMASAYATLADSGIYHRPHFVQKVVNADGRVLFDATSSDNAGEQRIPKDVADNVTSAMQPIAAYSRGHALAGGRPSAAKTGTTQFGDTDADKDAWMVGYTPSLSTAVWVGTDARRHAAGHQVGRPRSTAPVCRRTSGRRRWTARSRAPPTRPSPSRPRSAAPPGCPPRHRRHLQPPQMTVIQPTMEIAPGITIPIGPPHHGPVSPAPAPPPPGAPEPAPATAAVTGAETEPRHYFAAAVGRRPALGR